MSALGMLSWFPSPLVDLFRSRKVNARSAAAEKFQEEFDSAVVKRWNYFVLRFKDPELEQAFHIYSQAVSLRVMCPMQGVSLAVTAIYCTWSLCSSDRFPGPWRISTCTICIISALATFTFYGILRKRTRPLWAQRTVIAIHYMSIMAGFLFGADIACYITAMNGFLGDYHYWAREPYILAIVNAFAALPTTLTCSMLCSLTLTAGRAVILSGPSGGDYPWKELVMILINNVLGFRHKITRDVFERESFWLRHSRSQSRRCPPPDLVVKSEVQGDSTKACGPVSFYQRFVCFVSLWDPSVDDSTWKQYLRHCDRVCCGDWISIIRLVAVDVAIGGFAFVHESHLTMLELMLFIAFTILVSFATALWKARSDKKFQLLMAMFVVLLNSAYIWRLHVDVSRLPDDEKVLEPVEHEYIMTVFFLLSAVGSTKGCRFRTQVLLTLTLLPANAAVLQVLLPQFKFSFFHLTIALHLNLTIAYARELYFQDSWRLMEEKAMPDRLLGPAAKASADNYELPPAVVAYQAAKSHLSAMKTVVMEGDATAPPGGPHPVQIVSSKEI